MAQRGRVIVVGSSNTDLVCHCEKLPQAGETVLGSDLLTFAGGKGANQAVAAASAGGKVHFIGAFGNDAFGVARRKDLEVEGIDCSGSFLKKGVPSGVALIGIGASHAKDKIGKTAKAENQIIVAPGANARLTPADVKASLSKLKLTNEDVLLCSLEVPFDAIATTLQMAAAVQATAILNPAPFPQKGLPPALLKWSTVITPNETESSALLGDDLSCPKTQARLLKLMKAGCTNVIVTQGSQGVKYLHYSEGILGQIIVPAPKVKAVDTVGAGDCFNGSFAACLSADASQFESALRFAVTAAALKVTRSGAQAGMPKRAEVLRLL